MKKTFLAYYKPTVRQFDEMWENGLIVLDANVLLNLYRYSEASSKDLLRILGEISDRLWMPHQAGLEYQRNRYKTIRDQSKAYKTVIDSLDSVCKDLEKKLEGFKNHPLIKTDEITKEIKETCEKCKNGIEELNKSHPRLHENDTIRDELDILLEGKIGLPYDQSRLSEIYKVGKVRFDSRIPPGYEDVKNKEGSNRYGDLIIWFQMIDKAIESKKAIIFVTDDDKDDWWQRISGETLGPRPELIEEMYDKAKTSFHMYSILQFMRFADKHLKQKVKPETIEEVKEIRAYDKSQFYKMAEDLIGGATLSKRRLGGSPAYPDDILSNAWQAVAGTSMNDIGHVALLEWLAETSTNTEEARNVLVKKYYEIFRNALRKAFTESSDEITREQNTEDKDSDK